MARGEAADPLWDGALPGPHLRACDRVPAGLESGVGASARHAGPNRDTRARMKKIASCKLQVAPPRVLSSGLLGDERRSATRSAALSLDPPSLRVSRECNRPGAQRRPAGSLLPRMWPDLLPSLQRAAMTQSELEQTIPRRQLRGRSRSCASLAP